MMGADMGITPEVDRDVAVHQIALQHTLLIIDIRHSAAVTGVETARRLPQGGQHCVGGYHKRTIDQGH